MSKEVKVMLAIGALILLGAVYMFMKGGTDGGTAGAPIDDKALLRAESHYRGTKLQNKVTLIEFGDFQCPACEASFPIIEKVMDHYKDNPDFTFVFRNFPLTSIHPNAQLSAEASEAAGEQGKFWEMYARLYQAQNDWAEINDPLDTFVSYTEGLGINKDQFKSALQNAKFRTRVNEDVNDANKLGVDSTPTFYLNGEKIAGGISYDAWINKIDPLLK